MEFYKNRGRPWRYSVIPSTPDFPTEYQIRRNSNPAGLPVFAPIWGPDLRASTIILTHMFKQIKQIIITLMAMFKINPASPKWGTLMCTQPRGTRGVTHMWLWHCLSCAWLLSALVSHCVKPDSLNVRLPASLPHLLIAMKSAVSFPTELSLAGHHVWKSQASEMTFWSLAFMC